MSNPSLLPAFAHPNSAQSGTQNAAAPSASYRVKLTQAAGCVAAVTVTFSICSNLFPPLRLSGALCSLCTPPKRMTDNSNYLPFGCKAVLPGSQIATLRAIVVLPPEDAAVRQEGPACP